MFMFVDAHRPWRHVKVTDRRRSDFAECMRDLVDVHYPDGGPHSCRARQPVDPQARLALPAFEPAEARAILRRLEFHYTPKHASWLNMVEIEIGVMARQCLDRRIDSHASSPRSQRGSAAQCRRPHQVDVHNRKGQNQNGPRLSKPAVTYPEGKESNPL